jgi:hypothetical protein
MKTFSRVTVTFLAGFAASGIGVNAALVTDPLSHVNLFIGTVNGGHTFPGESTIGCCARLVHNNALSGASGSWCYAL